MILTYSRDRFVELIQSGSKIHTIRTDRTRRWKPGRSIQHWRGNPRNVRESPYQFATGECRSVQHITITRTDRSILGFRVRVDNRILSPVEIIRLAENDGLTVELLGSWFLPAGVSEFDGVIIHFTDRKY